MALKIVKVKEKDTIVIQAVIDLTAEGENTPSANHLKKLLADDRTCLLAAVLDDKVIGYLLAYRFPSLYSCGYLAYLYDIEVLKNYRRRGAGRLMIQTLLALLRSEGVNELWLGTATGNSAAQALFKATGGIQSGETFYDFTYTLMDK